MGKCKKVYYDHNADDIVKQFERYGAFIKIKDKKIINLRTVFEIRLKGATRELQLFARVPDVQLKLKIHFFQAFKQNFTIFIAVSKLEIKYPSLPKVLNGLQYTAFKEQIKMSLPCIVGYNILGNPTVVDLASENHVLIGGSSGSGKSVALQCLLLNIVTGTPTSRVNLLIIDVGANDLIPFNGVPHLSCPIIRNAERGWRALQCLKEEMERRIDIEITNNDEFKLLPRIICIIDEFPALISGISDNRRLKQLVKMISSLLQRGRHAKIHIILAAQNPTIKNMKIDLGNITTRMAFRCAKRNFSETILDESGAEHLLGKGDMCFKSPNFDGIKRIQGVFISSNELKQALVPLNLKRAFNRNSEHMFIVPEMDLQQEESDVNDEVKRTPNTTIEKNVDDALLAKILLWALEHQFVSGNKIIQTFKVGWPRAASFLEKLHEFGIAGDIYKKFPHAILPQCIEDIPNESINFLSKNGVSVDDITNALRRRENI